MHRRSLIFLQYYVSELLAVICDGHSCYLHILCHNKQISFQSICYCTSNESLVNFW